MISGDREHGKGRTGTMLQIGRFDIFLLLPFEFSWVLVDPAKAHPPDSPIKRKVRFGDSVFQYSTVYSIFPCYFMTSTACRIKPIPCDLLFVGLTSFPFTGCWLF